MRRSLALSLIVVAFVATNVFALAEARLTGKIMDAATKQPILNATILVVNADNSANFKQEFKVSPKDGTYALMLLDGTRRYKFTFSAPGYAPFEQVMKLQLGQPNTRDVTLVPANAAAPAAAAVAADPSTAMYNEAATLANSGKVPEAIAKLEEVIKAKPDFPAAWGALARLYLRQKDYQKAIDAGNKSLTFDADDPDMNAVLYDAYTATGNKEKAAEFRAKAPANPGALFNDAAKLINSGKDNDAEPLLKQAIAADPKFAVAYYELGMVYVRTGKNADAKMNLQKYLELDPTGKDAATAKEMLNYVK